MSWQIAVVGGMNAHFKQPEGPSRPATEWAVSIRGGDEEHRVLVRTYYDEHSGLTQEQTIGKVLQFVGGLLANGWHPSFYRQTPGELIVPPSSAQS